MFGQYICTENQNLVENNDKNKTNGCTVHIFHLKMWTEIHFEFLTICLHVWALGIQWGEICKFFVNLVIKSLIILLIN